MKETEKRRKKLLEDTRNLYQESRTIPAVHPRYKATYYRLYPDEVIIPKNTLGIRFVICILIFVTYILIGDNENSLLDLKRMQVAEKIMQNSNLKLY